MQEELLLHGPLDSQMDGRTFVLSILQVLLSNQLEPVVWMNSTS